MKNIILIFITSLILVSNITAEEIYKWISEDGVAHYSNKKVAEPKAQLANLPKLNKGDFKVGSVNGMTCDKHGGINCQAGPDVDGSVVCIDGFAGAVAPFKQNCSSAKLKISDISAPDTLGRIKVFVRNNKSVAAKTPALIFTSNEGAKLKLKGPDEIAPYEMAEFSMISSALAKNNETPTESQFSISCANCD
ncbi:MAG: hypothetical protein SGJ02_12460 [bacterium]|nr:hypothetical protein [bacterium]